jgi:hypothetical protein
MTGAWVLISLREICFALTAVARRYPELNCKNDHQNRDFDEYCAVFDCMIDPVSRRCDAFHSKVAAIGSPTAAHRRYLSEDYAFCRRWQQMGGKIHADVTTTLGHVGNLPFSGNMSERLKSSVRV